MMRSLLSLCLLLSGPGFAAAALDFDDSLLELKAQARACYMGFIELYDADYYARPGVGRCIRLSYLRDFSGEALDEATVKVFKQRHGEAMVARYREDLARIGAAYRPVVPGDRYTYCVGNDSGGVLLRDGEAVARIDSNELAERFLQIWVRSDAPDSLPEWGFGQC